MAVTNRQIIAAEKMTRNILEEVNTYAGWKRKGYQVQKGSKALFVTMIWKPCKPKKGEQPESADETLSVGRNMVMVKAAFFGLHQVKEVTA